MNINRSGEVDRAKQQEPTSSRREKHFVWCRFDVRSFFSNVIVTTRTYRAYYCLFCAPLPFRNEAHIDFIQGTCFDAMSLRKIFVFVSMFISNAMPKFAIFAEKNTKQQPFQFVVFCQLDLG